MNPPTINPRWGSDAAALLAQFLQSPVGALALARIQFNRPMAIAGANIDAAALRGAEVAGYEKCLSEFLTLLKPDPDPEAGVPQPSYPALDDDNQWPTKPQ